MRALYLVLIFTISITAVAQPNCNVYSGECRRACELYNGIQEYQGLHGAQRMYDSVIAICPTFAPAHHERSVAFLKNGEFLKWREFMDEAVRLDPSLYLGNRGWCRFKFLHDYRGAIEDIEALAKMNKGHIGWSNDGDYDLHIVLALCYREIGDTSRSLQLFEEYFRNKESGGSLAMGSYDYVHYGVTLLRAGAKEKARTMFEKQTNVYKQLPDSYYYLALLAMEDGDREKAVELIRHGEEYYKAGYYRRDPYCEALDEVYPSDMRELAGKLK
jgi:tetratricopeptide (TPR) repeat protein